MAATSVFVLDPGEAPQVQELCDEGKIHMTYKFSIANCVHKIFGTLQSMTFPIGFS